MPLTQAQLTGIDRTINGYTDVNNVYHEGLNDMVNKIINAREDVLALVRINTDIDNDDATSCLNHALTRGKDAADDLVALLS